MKSPVISGLGLVAGCASAIAPVVVLIPLNATALCAAVAGMAATLTVGIACSDYTRKPRFLHGSRRPAAATQAVEQPGLVDVSVGWTHHTVSA
jgi:hypothetical protein